MKKFATILFTVNHQVFKMQVRIRKSSLAVISTNSVTAPCWKSVQKGNVELRKVPDVLARNATHCPSDSA